MKVVVTGGAGFIGSHVVELLLSQNVEVLVLDNFSTGREENLDSRINVERGDICISKFTLMAFSHFHPDAVIHLAAQPAISSSWEFPVFDSYVNTQGTLNVIMACWNTGVKRLIFSSTSAVYSSKITGMISEFDLRFPDCPYGISKLAAESYVRLLFSESIVCRFGNVYGPRQVPLGENQVIPRMIRHFEFGDKFFIHGDGNQSRDFVFVTDVALALFRSLTGRIGTYNIASGKSTSVNELAAIMERIYEVPGYAWEHDGQNDPRRSICMSPCKAKDGLSWKPNVEIKDGIEKTVEWWKHDQRTHLA